MFKQFNANPKGARVGDCTIRAIAKATGKSWEQVYCGVVAEGLRLCDMPSSNAVWGAYLKHSGFKRHVIPDSCPDCYTVEQFCEDHPEGTYVLCISGHVVACVDGCTYDTWDSTQCTPLFYWERSDD